jgi:ABC-type xylose transport system permease subunit
MKKSNLKINADYKSALADTTSKPAADLTLAERVMAPTPKFFKTLRTIGIVIGLVGGAILASPLALPAVVVTVGGYLALAGSIVTGVSQTAVGKE